MKKWAIILAGLLIATGCAHQKSATTQPIQPPASAADPKARMPLDQIPPPVTALPAPATQPSSPAPAEAIILYAKGLDDLIAQHPYPAIDSFREAIQLDPNSFELYLAMGRAQLERLQIPSDESFDAFERAAAIRPDDLDVQLLLGRQYFAIGNLDKALWHLRLALLTQDYADNAQGSAAVELFLGKTLEQKGYWQASLDEYLSFERRVKHPTQDLFSDPDTSFVASAPQVLTLEIAQLYEQLNDFQNAYDRYKTVADADPANFPLQVKMVLMLIRMEKPEEAVGLAADVVARFQANSESLALLHDTCEIVGPPRELEVLQNLHNKNPSDHGILFALSDALVAQGKADDAEKLLTQAAAANPDDEQIIHKLYDFYVVRNDIPSAARLLITHLAVRPDSLTDMNLLFMDLIRPTRKNSLRLEQLQKLDVPPEAEAAKLYWVAQTAQIWQRDALAKSSIDRAVKLLPPFPPAFPRYVSDEWARPELSAEQKAQACDDLADSLEKGGDPILAAEVRGLNLTYQNKFEDAATQLQKALQLGGSSPDLQLTYAAVLSHLGHSPQCEQALWKLVAAHPTYDGGWQSLYDFYAGTNRMDQAGAVLAQWLKADPGSPDARVAEAHWTGIHGQDQLAVQQLAALLADHSDDARIMEKIGEVYAQLDHLQDFITALETIRAQQPANMTVVSQIVDIAVQLNRGQDVLPLLDETRKAVDSDPDLLYELSVLYNEAGQREIVEAILQQVLKIDPGNVPASNDLGFDWADQGINLPEAEKLIRVAVDAEPDNQAFLDSLGWVLYKRGKFDESAKWFAAAIGSAALPDWQVLDHYGDVFYRMNRSSDAQAQWMRALAGMSRDRDLDPAQLAHDRDLITKKIQAAAGNKPAAVAPLGGEPPATQPDQ
jgi:tetratricopeptide (TPR) repeat protein